MRKAIYTLTILVIACYGRAAGQKHGGSSSFLFSVEPNVTMGNRQFNGKPALFVKNKNALGFGLNIGFQKDWDHVFANARFHFVANRNALTLDLAGAGINDSSRVTYSQGSYSFEYNSAFGLNISGGYRFDVFDGNAIYLGAGVTTAYTVQSPSTNAIEVYTGFGNNSGVRNVYYEQLTSNPSFVAGADLSANYSFFIGNAHLLTGVHYYLIPGQKVKGEYVSFSGMPSESSGTFAISRSYLCLSLGIMTGGR